ncbi:hypothetical protein [Streptomyces antimycoticus]|uniref:hypothetical protein n=1 Tax=Streptomyces TaxID=1883 RepID=UPI0034069BC8
MNQPDDTCRPVEIDGETIRVRGAAEMSNESRAMLAEVVGAAKRKYAAEHPPTVVTDPERRERYAAALYATLEVSPTRHPWETLSPLRRAVWYVRADAAMKLADEERTAVPAVQSPADRAAEVEQLRADVEHWQRMYNAEHARHVEVVGALVTDRAAILREFLSQLDERLLGCCEECNACAAIARDLAAEFPEDDKERRLAGEQPTPDEAASCPGFPERCPNLRTVEPNPPEHYGGIRCGCGDTQPPA